MPFGFEQKQIERKLDNPDLLEQLQPIEVNAVMKKDGTVRPLSITWEDEEYKIDKVINVKDGKSLKEFQAGSIYRCRVGQKEFILVYEGQRWFIDV